MGDYDSEIYRGVNDIYGEVSNMRQAFADMNASLKQLLEEVKGLRNEMGQPKGPPM